MKHMKKFLLRGFASFGFVVFLILCGFAIYLINVNPRENSKLSKKTNFSQEELLRMRKVGLKSMITKKIKYNEKMVDRMYEKYLSNPRSTLDFLIISGGGENASFGTGFLVGWSTVMDQNFSMPLFDGVVGVSAGSLIAPFAYIGTSQSLEFVDNLFRHPQSSFVRSTSPFPFLPGNQSLLAIPGLEKAIHGAFTEALAKKIVQSTSQGRLLLIQATNLDLAIPGIFDFVEIAKESLETKNSNSMINVVLASSAIPGVFPPREIDGYTFVDGAVESNIYYGGHPSLPSRTFGGAWKKKYPEIPIPTIRLWVIVNGNLREAPNNHFSDWISVALRSLAVSEGANQVAALRELYSFAELSKSRGLGNVEVRWVSIESTLKGSSFPHLFDKKLMIELSDLGRRLGSNPYSWNTKEP